VQFLNGPVAALQQHIQLIPADPCKPDVAAKAKS
jgi:hypothetical protein